MIVCLFCFSGRIPRLSLIRHNLDIGVVEKPPPHHSQGSSTERWSRNTSSLIVDVYKYTEVGHFDSAVVKELRYKPANCVVESGLCLCLLVLFPKSIASQVYVQRVTRA